MTWLDDYRATHWHPAHLKPLNLPERFAHADPFALPAALQDPVRRYLQGIDSYLPQGVAPSFLGPAFTFKTHAACVILRFAHGHAQVEGHFFDCLATLTALENRRFDPKTLDYLSWLESVPLLVLDDFTNVRDRGWKLDTLVGIATARFNRLRPTMWTGNAQVETVEQRRELGERYGPCLMRRLAHGSDGFRLVT